MADIISCTIASGLDYDSKGSDSSSYNATWHVRTDEFMPGSVVLAKCQQSFGVPRKGDAFLYRTNSGYVALDTGAYALDFACRLVDGMKSKTDYTISVTWRQPTPGGGETPTQVVIENPLDRPSEWWIEYGSGEEVKWKGLPVTNTTTGAVGSLERMKNSVDEPMPPVILQSIRPIIVRSRFVSSPLEAVKINNKFENTTNNADWTIQLVGDVADFDTSDFEGSDFNTSGVYTIQKHHARFLRAETGRVQYKGNVRYFVEETRIEISRDPYYDYRPNEGTFYKVSSKKKQEIDDTGFVLPGPYPLKSDGTLATAADIAEKPYLVLYTADFSELT